MVSINWHNIRPIKGDQKEGFEELVAQLVRKENVPNKFRYIRKGKPDAGVECYWILKDGTEWAWQAKYFTSSLQDSQWSQIDDSVKTLIKRHKKVTKYTISIPNDPPDARREDQTSMFQKWETHVKKWMKWAKKEKMDIKFIPWWHFDLIEKLSKPENAGMLLFWFDKDAFTDDWFIKNVTKSIHDLGTRYTPELNVELDISKIFDGIARNEWVFKDFNDHLDKVLIAIRKIRLSHKNMNIRVLLEKMENMRINLIGQYEIFQSCENNQYDFSLIKKILDEITQILSIIEDELRKIEGKRTDKKSKSYDDIYYFIRRALSELYDFDEYIDSPTIKLFNSPYLILDGDQGIGKSHLIADIAKKRIDRKDPTLLILGQHLNSLDNPWVQILRNLEFNSNSEDFLEALSCKAIASGKRMIFFIDALNEGEGKSFWPDYLNGFLTSFIEYPWIGLVLSIRTSYIKLIEPNIKNLDKWLVRYTHFGFRNIEYIASTIFFDNYNIEKPSIPFLHPEFQNPLFLKLFCEGLNKEGLSKIPDGIQGISRIFDFYIKSINNRLSTPRFFDYHSALNIVDIVIKSLIKHKINNKLSYVPLDDGIKITSDIQRQYNIDGNFFDALISEGILSKNIFWKENETFEEGVYIAYERLEDHLSVSDLLETFNEDNIKSEFEENGCFFNFTKDEHSIMMSKGIIEALSIQLPEKFNIELFQINDKFLNNYQIAEAFISSLLWRKNDIETSEEIFDYINNSVLKYRGTYEYFWDTVIAISINPKHFLNARRTHQNLMRFSLADRDSWWTQLIYDWYHDNSSLKRLIDWAWSNNDKQHISDETIELASIMLSWFLTSTNRLIRDSATKALVCLLETRKNLLVNVLKIFQGVNDPYIYERLFAVAYGCALRTRDVSELKELCVYIYREIFKKEYVYPHVLLRDYARDTIEYAISNDLQLDIDIMKIRPPYSSKFPDIPSDEEIRTYQVDHESEDFEDHHWSIYSIFHSMEVEYTRDGRGGFYGDFGRYIFQSNFDHWRDLDPVDLKNIAIKRIFELGYDKEKHGKFDRQIKRNDRHFVAVERIGKKYQWIAMHELLAQVSDNFKMEAPWSWGKNKEMINFEGPWEPFIRDIDPSNIQIIDDDELVKSNSPIISPNWDKENVKWLKTITDLPNPKLIINHDSVWTLLEGYSTIIEDKNLGDENHSIPRKQFWWKIISYFVRTVQFERLYQKLTNRNFMEIRMPESHDRYEIFNREYYWSPAYNFLKKKYYDQKDIRQITDPETREEIGEVIVTTESYLWSAQYDLSKDKDEKWLKPCELLVDKLKLQYKKNESYMYDQNNNLICFDNSEGNDNFSSLYIDKDVLLKFLKDNDLKIIWIFLSEKNIVGGDSRKEYERWPISSGAFTFSIRKKIKGKVNQF